MSSSHTTPKFDQADITQSGPQRKCIITGQVADKTDDQICSVTGWPAADTGNKLGGRGVWVSAVRETPGRALSGNRFSRHLKQAV